MALVVRPPGHLARREIAYRIVVHIVHLLEAGAYEGNGGHRALLSCDASPPHARRLTLGVYPATSVTPALSARRAARLSPRLVTIHPN